jgi:hypothetical protein
MTALEDAFKAIDKEIADVERELVRRSFGLAANLLAPLVDEAAARIAVLRRRRARLLR